MGERYVQVLFVVPMAVPVSMLNDGGWIEKQALEAIARGDWELEEEFPTGHVFPRSGG